MRRFRSCLFLFAASCAVCLAAGLHIREEAALRESVAAAEESLHVREESLESELETLGIPVSDQGRVTQRLSGSGASAGQAEEEYYLVCEDGFLLVFLKDKKTICLYTHIPITDFPPDEQGRLHDGIWFSGMMEVFHYLESYTS